MDFNLQAEWANVSGAPLLFVGTVLVVAALIWVVAHFLNRNKIENLESRLQLRDDEIADYKRKLDGATPEEAQARIARLEQQVAALAPKPRTLTDGQKSALAEAVRDTPYDERAGLYVIYAQSSLETALFADQIAGALRDGGWVISAHQSLAAQRLRERGLTLALPNLAEKPSNATAVAKGLENAGLVFKWVEDEEMPSEGVLFVDMAEEGG